jgi:hypothetical protein
VAAEQIIEAPGVVDNFYINSLDVSRHGFLAVGLSDGCYLYRQSACFELKCAREFWSHETCLKFNRQGSLLVIGNAAGDTQILDIATLKLLRTFKVHSQRVGTLEHT